jgi:hypothetical protein
MAKTQSILKLALAAIALQGTSYADQCNVRTTLRATPADTDAKGSVSAALANGRSVLLLSTTKLNPNSPYQVLIGGVEEGSFITNSSGSGTLVFYAPRLSSRPTVDFDPRGQSIEVADGGTIVLEGVFSGRGEASTSSVADATALTNTVTGSRARAAASFTRTLNGLTYFNVGVTGVTAGDITVQLDGRDLGTIRPINGNGSLLMRSGTPVRPWQPLSEDPRGKGIDLIQSGNVIFTGMVKAKALGANVDKPQAITLGLQSTGEDPDASAKAKLRVAANARRDFSVEIEDMDAGSYDLLINNEVKGQLVVASTGEAELEFTNGDDQGKLPLDFDPINAAITVQQGATIYFTATFNPAVLNGVPPPEPRSDKREDLTSTGFDPDAAAEGRYEVDSNGRHRFNVEIEDVAAGLYTLKVGGVVRAAIRAVSVDGTVEGEVEFRSIVEPGKVLLNFDPRGQLLELVDVTGNVLFSHTFGDGSGTIGQPVLPPKSSEMALFAQPGSSGSASLRYRRDKGEEQLKIKLRAVPAGSYDISVGGTIRGTITAVVSGGETEGEAEFESSPDAGDQLLNFPVLGQEVVVSQGGTAWFRRTLQ